MEHVVFVPNGDSRQETATLLVGTAEEYNIDQRSIKVANSGFLITEELADIIYDGAEVEVEAEKPGPKTTKKTSGTKAVKNDSTEGE